MLWVNAGALAWTVTASGTESVSFRGGCSLSHQQSKKRAITTPKGVKAVVGARSRARRERQTALTKLAAQAPVRLPNDLAPHLNLVLVPTERLRPASRPIRRRTA
jgi:hypothetical protein